MIMKNRSISEHISTIIDMLQQIPLLKRKQTWLRSFKLNIPRFFGKHQQSINATLVFAQEEAGTAVCISPDGLILTCSHCVAASEDELDYERTHWLLFCTGQAVSAKCIAWDCRRDLALLRIIGDQVGSLDQKFPHVAVDSITPPLDSKIVCVGHPGSEDLEASLPGIQSAPDAEESAGLLPGIGAPQPPPPGLPGTMGGMDPGRLAAIMGSQAPPPPGPPGNTNQGVPPGFPMLPGMTGVPPPPPGMNVDMAQLQKQLSAQGIQMPPNMNFQNMGGFGGLPGLQGGMPDGGRR